MMYRKLLYLLAVLALFVLALPVLGQQPVDPETNCDLDPTRINNHPHRDCSAPVQIYLANGFITVLTPKVGLNLPTVILETPIESPIPTNANTILAEAINPLTNRPVILSRLTTGEYQLNTFYADGTGYIVVWYGGPDLYHIDPVTNQPLDGARPIIAPDAANPSAGAASAAPLPSTSEGAGTGGEGGETTAPRAPSVPGVVDTSSCRVTTTRMVRLRAEPNTVSEILTILPYRSTWAATDYEANWYQIIYLNQQGWVSADFLTPIGSCAG